MVPSDCILLTTLKGGLVVSPSYGLYCAVLPEEFNIFRSYLEHSNIELPQSLAKRLADHGFDGEPRSFAHDPPLLQFQVTRACNLRCIYCAVDAGLARPNELSLDDVKRTIDEVRTIYPDIRISFTGGEPLIVPWIFDAIDYAESHSRQQVGLLSNLLLLKDNSVLFERVVNFLKRGHQLRVSMSGADREVCNRLSGKDCYDDAIQIIQRLAAEGVVTDLDIALSAPDAQANIQAFADFRRAIPEPIPILLGMIYTCGREKGDHVFESVQEQESVVDDICFEGGLSLKGLKPSPVTYRRNGCSCVDDENLYIQSDGEVFECVKLKGRIGHISEGMKTIVERRRKTALSNQVEPCRSCPFVYLCACGCLADRIVFQETHSEPFCGPWRKQVIAEALFEDKPYILEWSILHLMAEARRRGIKIE